MGPENSSRTRPIEVFEDSISVEVDLDLQRAPVEILSNWGQVSGTASAIYEAHNLLELRAIFERLGPRGAIIRGSGYTPSDVSQCGGGTVIRLAGSLAAESSKSIGWEAQKADVNLSTPISDLNKELLSHGWFLPTGVFSAQSTVGSAISTNSPGPSGTTSTQPCSWVNNITAITPQGAEHRFDLDSNDSVNQAFVGGLGLIGIGLTAEVNVIPVETAWMKVDLERTSDIEGTLSALDAASQSHSYAMAYLDPGASGSRIGRGLIRAAEHAELKELPETIQPHALRSTTHRPTPPRVVSTKFLNPRLVRAAHKWRFQTWPSEPTTELQPAADYFHIDDVAGKAAPIMGPQGMLRYQFSLPYESASYIATAIELIQNSRSALSRIIMTRSQHKDTSLLGAGENAWHVSLDVAHASASLADTLDRIDIELAALGGQVSLSSDSRLNCEALARMYPALEDWREVRRTFDPQGRFQSDLSRRLGL